MNMTRYEYLKMQHRCVRCGGRDAYTLGGRAVCSDCREKLRAREREYDRIHADERNKKAKERRAVKIASGLCVRCGKRHTDQQKHTCAYCLAKNRRRNEL